DAFDEATVYVRIDLVTGALSKIGTLNDPAAAVKYKSSGDLVALIRNGNRAFLTVHAIIDEAGTGKDQLAEVDPATGRIKSSRGETAKTHLWGLGQWAGKAYAFSDLGEILETDLTNGKTQSVTGIVSDAGPLAWYGAGVTTDAPTAP